LLTFLASAKTSLITLGIVSQGAGVGINFLSLAMKAIPIMAVIALIVLLVQNWDTVVDVVKKVWETIKDFLPKAWEKVKEFAGKVIGFVKDIIEAYLALPKKMFEIGKDVIMGLWDGIKNMANWLKDKITGLFGDAIGWAKKALGIKSPSRVFAGIGKNIARGLWTGLKREETYLKNNFEDFFGEIIPELTLDSLNLPDFNSFVTETDLINSITGATVDQSALAGTGLDWNSITEQFDIDDTVVTTAKLSELMNSNYAIPTLSSRNSMASAVNITINAGVGTDPYALGRTVQQALDKYNIISK